MSRAGFLGTAVPKRSVGCPLTLLTAPQAVGRKHSRDAMHRFVLSLIAPQGSARKKPPSERRGMGIPVLLSGRFFEYGDNGDIGDKNRSTRVLCVALCGCPGGSFMVYFLHNPHLHS